MSICVAGNFRQQLMLIALVWRVSLIMRSNNKCSAENDAGGGDGKSHHDDNVPRCRHLHE